MQLLISRIVQMAEQNLLCVCERSAQTLANDFKIGVDLRVGVLDEFRCRLDGGHIVLPAGFEGSRGHLSAGPSRPAGNCNMESTMHGSIRSIEFEPE